MGAPIHAPFNPLAYGKTGAAREVTMTGVPAQTAPVASSDVRRVDVNAV
jgi:hypothetical protein